MNAEPSLYPIVDAMQLSLDYEGGAYRGSAGLWGKIGSIRIPIQLVANSDFVNSSGSAVLLSICGDLWAYFITVKLEDNSFGLKMLLFNGKGKVLADLKTGQLQSTLAIIQPLTVACFDFFKDAWVNSAIDDPLIRPSEQDPQCAFTDPEP